MAILDPAKSAFAQARELIVESAAGCNTSWRQHAVQRISSLSRVAAVSIGLAVSMAPAMAHDSASPGTQVSAERAKALSPIYQAGINTDAKAWSSLRPNLRIYEHFSGTDAIDRGSLTAIAGVDVDKLETNLSKALLDNVNAAARSFRDDPSAPVGAMVTSNALFQPSKPVGGICAVHVNVHALTFHEEIKAKLGWSDEVVRDFSLRHERTHCLEKGDRDSLLLQELKVPGVSPGPLVTEKARLIYKEAATSVNQGSPSDTADDRLRMNYVGGMMAAKAPVIDLQAEEIADAVSLLTLVKEGRISTNDIGEIAQLRLNDWELDVVHDTSSFLNVIKDQIELNPSVLAKWKASHAESVSADKGLQIDDLLAWVEPIWKAHAAARDDHHQLTVGPSTTQVPEYPSVPLTIMRQMRTASHFTDMVKKDMEPSSLKAKP